MTIPLTRREAMVSGLGGALGMLLARPSWLHAAPPTAHATACVLLWLKGGPSQLETFDPKPGTKNGGPTRAIETAIKGVRFAEHLPGLAERARKLTVIRSLTSREGDHERASYLMHTGFTPSTTIRHPTLGSLISAELPARDDVPSFVSIGADPVGPGYRGVAQSAFVVRDKATLLDPSKGADPARRRARRELMESLEEGFARRTQLDPAVGSTGSARTAAYLRAERLLDGPLRTALAVDTESAATRDRYGRTQYGTSVLTARRLLEAGSRCVEVTLDGWDTHDAIFQNLPGRCRDLDRAFSALLDDLVARDRLSQTLVICMGEFGRTPTINNRDGRDHYPRAYSAVLAGGGLRPGVALGTTTPDGAAVADRPVQLNELYATLATRLGFDPAAQRYAGDRPITLVDKGTPIREIVSA